MSLDFQKNSHFPRRFLSPPVWGKGERRKIFENKLAEAAKAQFQKKLSRCKRTLASKREKLFLLLPNQFKGCFPQFEEEGGKVPFLQMEKETHLLVIKLSSRDRLKAIPAKGGKKSSIGQFSSLAEYCRGMFLYRLFFSLLVPKSNGSKSYGGKKVSYWGKREGGKSKAVGGSEMAEERVHFFSRKKSL